MTLILPRRSFLIGLGASLLAAPAIVRASSLMPVSPVRIRPASYWPQWKQIMDEGPRSDPGHPLLVLTPWQAEALAKPAGYKLGVHYVIQPPLPLIVGVGA